VAVLAAVAVPVGLAGQDHPDRGAPVAGPPPSSSPSPSLSPSPSPTGVSNVVCYGRYATAKPVPAVGGTHILFGYQLPERRWIVLDAGLKGMCDAFVLDGSISARLPGC
jgi:hypothetical protein